jgi:hypothetical protein
LSFALTVESHQIAFDVGRVLPLLFPFCSTRTPDIASLGLAVSGAVNIECRPLVFTKALWIDACGLQGGVVIEMPCPSRRCPMRLVLSSRAVPAFEAMTYSCAQCEAVENFLAAI